MNGMILTWASRYYAMAKEGLFFCSSAPCSSTHPRSNVGHHCSGYLGGGSYLYTLLGTFQVLFTYVIFTAWIFDSLSVAAVIILRIRRPEII